MASSESERQQAEAWRIVYDTCVALGFRPSNERAGGVFGVCAFIARLSGVPQVGLRDWFAGAALQAILPLGAGMHDRSLIREKAADYAQVAYYVADAMVAKREATPAADSEPAA